MENERNINLNTLCPGLYIFFEYNGRRISVRKIFIILLFVHPFQGWWTNKLIISELFA